MAEDFVRVKTKGYKTIEDLAIEYNITMPELVAFHNERCSFVHLLSLVFPRYLEYVYMPVQKYAEKKERTLPGTRLRPPALASCKTYGVLLNYYPKELQMHYKIDVTRNANNIVFNKERVFVNNKGIEKVAEQMFEKVDKTLYPLEVTTSDQGELNTIANSAEIKSRWKQIVLPALQQYYQSPVSDKLLKRFDLVFEDLNNKQELICRNLFYKFFLMPIYRNYLQSVWDTTLNVYFSALNREITYLIRYTLEHRYTENGKVVLKIEGTEEEDFFNPEREKGKISIQYKLHKETHEIYSVIATMSSYEEEIEHKIKFQMFEQKNK